MLPQDDCMRQLRGTDRDTNNNMSYKLYVFWRQTRTPLVIWLTLWQHPQRAEAGSMTFGGATCRKSFHASQLNQSHNGIHGKEQSTYIVYAWFESNLFLFKLKWLALKLQEMPMNVSCHYLVWIVLASLQHFANAFGIGYVWKSPPGDIRLWPIKIAKGSRQRTNRIFDCFVF